MYSHELGFYIKHSNSLRWRDLKNNVLVPVIRKEQELQTFKRSNKNRFQNQTWCLTVRNNESHSAGFSLGIDPDRKHVSDEDVTFKEM